MNRVEVIAVEPELASKADQLAAILADQWFNTTDHYQLIVSAGGLAIRKLHSKQKALQVNLASPYLTRRRHRAGFKNEAVARAVGAKGGKSLQVLDGTAGLGNDSFILASLGCKVLLLERSILVGLLLEDGLLRARNDPELQTIIQRMTLIREDSQIWLSENDVDDVDVIYLDPMFPPRKGTALSGREMQYLQSLVERDDSTQLIECALSSDVPRVVLKRPRLAKMFPHKPNFTITQRSCRFDVFVKSPD